MIEGQTMFYIQTSLNEAMPSSLEVFMSEYAHLNFLLESTSGQNMLSVLSTLKYVSIIGKITSFY